jgi:transcriptional regulator with XRE-family HTH domain
MQMTVQDALAGVESPLRAARKHLAMTLDEVAKAVTALDPRENPPAVTASELSAWERGLRKTSPHYRRLLCQFYQQPPEVLFAHQDGPPRPFLAAVGADRVALATSVADLAAAMLTVVDSATQILVVTGSRSRDPAYLAAIEQALTDRPRLIHYRVLFGPPRRQVLTDHLLRLLELRDPDDRQHGYKTLHLGIFDDLGAEPERFFVASEQRAVVALPSISTAGNFDTGVVLLDPRHARGLVEHGKQLYPAARKLETPDAVRALGAAQ